MNTTDLIQDFYFTMECEVEDNVYRIEGILSTTSYSAAVSKIEESFYDSEIGEVGSLVSINIESIPPQLYS